MPVINDIVALYERKAQARAAQDAPTAQLRFRQFGDLFNAVKGGAPVGLFIAHLMRVNPFGLQQPALTSDGRVGFMKVSPTESRDADIYWDKIVNAAAGELKPNIFVWSRALNASAREVHAYTDDIILTPDETFWKLTYCYQTLGGTAFKAIWNARNMQDTDYYHAFMLSAHNWNKTVAGWSVIQLNKVLLLDCPYVLKLAGYFGKLSTQKFGKLPQSI
jgi:hypothetical protein